MDTFFAFYDFELTVIVYFIIPQDVMSSLLESKKHIDIHFTIQTLQTELHTLKIHVIQQHTYKNSLKYKIIRYVQTVKIFFLSILP